MTKPFKVLRIFFAIIVYLILLPFCLIDGVIAFWQSAMSLLDNVGHMVVD